jgi:hypothetical protein
MQLGAATRMPVRRPVLWFGGRSPSRHDPTSWRRSNGRAEQEVQYWNKGVVDGWAQGEKQAVEIFLSDLSRLRRDIVGMARYRVLLRAGLVEEPRVAFARSVVEGGRDFDLRPFAPSDATCPVGSRVGGGSERRLRSGRATLAEAQALLPSDLGTPSARSWTRRRWRRCGSRRTWRRENEVSASSHLDRNR